MEAHEDPANNNPSLFALRNEFFRRCGRNLWLFQSVETLLKRLALAGRCEISLDDTHDRLQTRVDRVTRQSMGTLARGLSATILGPERQDDDLDGDLMRWSLRVEADGGFSEELRSKLGALVDERNRLAHHSQSRWDITDEASLQEALDTLDAQRKRILVVHDELRRLGLWVSQAVEATLCYFESSDFKWQWRQARLQQALLDVVERAGRADGWSPLTQVGQHWRDAVGALPEDERQDLPSLRRLLDACGWFEWRELPNPGGGSITFCRPRTEPRKVP